MHPPVSSYTVGTQLVYLLTDSTILYYIYSVSSPQVLNNTTNGILITSLKDTACTHILTAKSKHIIAMRIQYVFT